MPLSYFNLTAALNKELGTYIQKAKLTYVCMCYDLSKYVYFFSPESQESMWAVDSAPVFLRLPGEVILLALLRKGQDDRKVLMNYLHMVQIIDKTCKSAKFQKYNKEKHIVFSIHHRLLFAITHWWNHSAAYSTGNAAELPQRRLSGVCELPWWPHLPLWDITVSPTCWRRAGNACAPRGSAQGPCVISTSPAPRHCNRVKYQSGNS